MREDLIERLRREADISARPGQMDRLNALADEFAAALEAAREDAERLDALAALVDAQPDKALLLHHGMHKQAEQKHAGLGLSNTRRTLRQAIDQARGKGGCGEGVANG